MNEATKGELDAIRHCQFTDKLFLDEKITGFTPFKNVTIEAIKHNLPMLKHLSATYELEAIEENKTKLKMVSLNSASPAFMIHLMKGRLRKSVGQHLFGMKYFLETGKIVEMANYDAIYKNYHQTNQN